MRIKLLALLALISLGSALAQTPSVAGGGVLNGASFARGVVVAPGSIVSIFGTQLAGSLAQGLSIPLSTSIDGVQVTFNGIAAPLYFVSGEQINAQLPWNVLGSGGGGSGSVNVVVTRGSTPSQPVAVNVGPFSPGIFTASSGTGYAIAINPDGSLAAPAGSIPGIATRPVRASTPAGIGETVLILGTGLGAVTPPVANGANSLDATRATTTVPTVLVGGVPATVQFSGLSPQFPGVYQLNVVMPDVPAGDRVPLQIEMGGIRTSDQVIIAITR